MYNVLVVDDESIVRLGLKTIVNWENYGFSLDYEASNGKQAIKILIDNPEIDIVITDINMPVMNGIELISEIIKLERKIEIIVLSAYDDYNLVRQAFKLGINDYIIKSDMDPHVILKQFKNAADKIEGEKTIAGKVARDLNHDFKYLKEKLLKDLLEQDEVEDIEMRAKKINLNITGKSYFVCFLWVDNYEKIIDKYGDNTLKPFVSSIISSTNQVLIEQNIGEVLSISPQEYVLLLMIGQLNISKGNEMVSSVLGKIRSQLSNYMNIRLSIGVSNITNDIKNIRILYKQSEENAKLRFILGKGKTIYPNDVARITNAASEKISGKNDRFISALKEGDREKSFNELETLFDIIRKYNPLKIEKLFPFYVEILFSITKHLNEIGEDASSVFGKEVDFYEKISKFETRDEINVWLRNITDWVLNYIKEKRDLKISRAVIRAIEYIRANYSNEDLSLGMVSEFVGLSENRFSTLFAKETNKTFVEYLTTKRIEKAKDLLSSTSLKVYEIAEKVGYSNAEYFSRIFKKITGKSPNSYNIS